MKKVKVALVLSMVFAVLVSTGCKHPGNVIPEGNTPEDPKEDEIWDLGNVKISDEEVRSVSHARGASSSDSEVVTRPCTADDFTGDDLLRFYAWTNDDENTKIFTDDVISQMFKFEPVVNTTDAQNVRTGIKITYTKPVDAPYAEMYWLQILLFDKNGNVIVTQEMNDIKEHSDGYEWFFPYVDPKRHPGKPDIIVLQFKADDRGVSKMYKITSVDGLGKPKDLPSYKEQKNHLIIDTNKKTYTLKNVKIPDEKNLRIYHQLIAIGEKQIDYDGETIKGYPYDENGRPLYKVMIEVEQSVSDSDKKNKRSFELDYKNLNGFADKNDYPYWYIRTAFKYENDDYEGIFHGVSLLSEVYDNDYFSIPTHERKQCSLKDAYYSEINNEYATFDFSALKDLDKIISFTITTKENGAPWVGMNVNNNEPWMNISSEKGTRDYFYNISDMKAIQDYAESVSPTKEHNYVVNFYPLLKSGQYSLDDVQLYDTETATVALNTNGGTVSSLTVECAVGPDITSTLPIPVYSDGFFDGWFTDPACTESFKGKVSGNINLYAKKTDKIDLSGVVEMLSQYGNIHFDYTPYLGNYADKYVCFEITKTKEGEQWVGVSVDNHYEGKGFIELNGEPAGTYKYAVKLGTIKEREDAILEATNGTWGEDPHWNSKYLVFGNFLKEGCVYTPDALFLSAFVPEGFIELN